MSNRMQHYSAAKELVDCSQLGDRECLRSTCLDSEPFALDSEERHLADSGGLLTFGCVMPRQPLGEEDATKDPGLAAVVQIIKDYACTFGDGLYVLCLFCTAISACERAGHWCLALQPLHGVPEQHLQPDTAT